MIRNLTTKHDHHLDDQTESTKLEAEILAITAGLGDNSTIDPADYRYTDAGNAELLVALHGENIRYVEEWRCWMVWNGSFWQETSDTSLLELAKRTTEQMFVRVSTLPPKEDIALRKHANASQKIERLKAMINIAKSDKRVRLAPNDFDSDPWLLGCGRITINLQNGTHYQAKREDFITKATAVEPNMDADCPNWKALINWAFEKDQDTIEHLQRVFGYMLTGDVSEEKLFSFHGSGSNGKTTIAMTIYDILGNYSGKARSDLLVQSQGEKGSASPDIAALQGKRFVLVSETDEDNSLAEAQIKAITSNEPIPARRLHRDPFTFSPTHKTILMSNHKPFIKGTDDGIWRRMNIIGFHATMPEQDRNPRYREEKLSPEYPAILAWMLHGCAMWLEDRLKPSAKVVKATAAYRSEMDYFGEWLEEQTSNDPKARTTRKQAYLNYELWAKENGAPVLKKKRFTEQMESRGYKLTTIRGSQVYRGLKIFSEYDLQRRLEAA